MNQTKIWLSVSAFCLLPSAFLLLPAKCRAPPKLVLRVELRTSTLPMWRSTTELYQRDLVSPRAAGYKTRPTPARTGSVEGARV